ncbi:MAG: glycosyltransferase [Bacteroidetes bacterium]|nr:glycosyltransferase [Bacteroidota bacterium]
MSTKEQLSNKLVFLCGARDFHAMDWYKSAKELLPNKDIYILTDLIAGEGFKKLINEKDIVFKLIIIDNFLLKGQSNIGNVWRNLVKLVVFPIQVILIKKFSRRLPGAIYHAHSMYYLFLAWAAGVRYVGTPQGSDILIKPFKSRLYRYFAIKSLRAAKVVTVDSGRMNDTIFELTGLKSRIIQNGIDLHAIDNVLSEMHHNSFKREGILSSRAFTELYRIKDIVSARNSSSLYSEVPLTLIYPFYEEKYMEKILELSKPCDVDLGRVDRGSMYQLLMRTKLVISIPQSDSSPRSVYEAVFCGCAVAITYHSFYDVLPQCMKTRIVLIDLDDEDWLDKAVKNSDDITSVRYCPSDQALTMFDQRRSFKEMEKLLFAEL